MFKSLNAKCKFTCTVSGFRQRRAIPNCITLYIVLFAVLGMFMPVQAMIYRPEKGAMWDPSVIYHDGKYYAFMMYNKDGQEGLKAKHCLVASLTDGVHGKDEGIVNEERESTRECRFFKGFVARCGDNFIMDHRVAWSEGQDTLRFYQSSDLKNWNYLFSSHPDPRWYVASGRRGHMYIIPKEQGAPQAGYWGYSVATPKPHLSRAPGMTQSPNGTDWEILPPAEMKWGDTPERDLEHGGSERIGDKYYLIGGAGEYVSKGYSMYTLVGDAPCGPFRPDIETYRLCGTTSKTVTWLAAWARARDELLVSNYASFSSDKGRPSMLPLRKPVVDKDGHLRLGWWKGNDALKGKSLTLEKNTIESNRRGKKSHYQIVYLTEAFDVHKGVMLEERIKARLGAAQGDFNDKASKAKPAAGFVFEEGPKKSVAIQLDIGQPENRETNIGTLQTTAERKMQFQSEGVIGKGCATVTGIENGKEHRFRPLVRRGMFELYIDDMLMQTYVYKPASGKVGFVVHNASVVFSMCKPGTCLFDFLQSSFKVLDATHEGEKYA